MNIITFAHIYKSQSYFTIKCQYYCPGMDMKKLEKLEMIKKIGIESEKTRQTS